jgi:hypothetical protein
MSQSSVMVEYGSNTNDKNKWSYKRPVAVLGNGGVWFKPQFFVIF